MTKELGPLMVDVEGLVLTEADRHRLMHPAVGGVILFARNFESREQVKQLTAEIHALRSPALLISVDHEGGRVQRFREGFTAIPPMLSLGQTIEEEPELCLAQARQWGRILARELLDVGVDFSFTPVLDLDYGTSEVIGNRAFHRHPEHVAALAAALRLGLQDEGMIAVGKHFPGHGYVEADSHVAVPVDTRSWDAIQHDDLIPFQRLIDGGLEAIMPAHVIYPEVDSRPAGFSDRWLKEILREQMGFKGFIFSDDLSMEGASVVGLTLDEKSKAALKAGCDGVLICNHMQDVDDWFVTLAEDAFPCCTALWEKLRPNK